MAMGLDMEVTRLAGSLGAEVRGFALRDVGPVVYPAYSDTEASLRSLAEQRSLDLTDLLQAAEANNLRDWIFPAPTIDDEEPGDTHSNTVRRHWALR